jgi:uncharacterized membrane protein YvlD (DUF360 family)
MAVQLLADSVRRLITFYALQVRLLWDWRPGRLPLLRRALVSLVVGAVSLAVTAWLLPGVTLRDVQTAIAVVVLLAFLNALIRPVLLAVIAPFSVLGLVIASFVFQVLIFEVADRLVAGFEVDTFGSAFGASVIFALLNMSLTALFALNQTESYYGMLVRRLARERRDVVRTSEPGVVFVQIDGLAHGVLAHQVRAGRVPYLASLLRSRQARLTAWEVLLPSQTSASQAGILHGRNDGIPAFRWYEKGTHRLMVSNRPDDASEIERRVSDGHGLLAPDGASIGNLLSGDAARVYFTMSRLRRHGLGRSQSFYSFFLNPSGYLGTIALTLGEVGKELVQAARTSRAGIEPRIHRGLRYAVARAITNVLLRNVSTSLVIDEMYRGTPVIYVDYVDYDEIAHYSGPERSEALDALDGLDRTIRSLARAATEAPRPYSFVVLSDHGQTLGATFRTRYGASIEQVIRGLTGESVRAETQRAESEGRLNALATEVAQAGGTTGALARQATRSRQVDGVLELGARQAPAGGTADVVVCASGNLANVYFLVSDRRLGEREIEAAYPGLIGSLVAHPGIGLVMVRSAEGGLPVAIGARGRHDLASGDVVGLDPVAIYGAHAAAGLRGLDEMRAVGDLVLVSAYEPDTAEVAAFEELVGSHGGIGGAQTEPFLLHPSAWVVEGPLVGAPAVHRQLRRWLTSIGIGLHPVSESGQEAAETTSGSPASGTTSWVAAAGSSATEASGPLSGVPRP